MLTGAVADDFTGATDLAAALHSRGLRTAVVIGDRPVPDEQVAGLDAVVVALKSRTAPVEEAVGASLGAADRLLGWGADRFYLKYCSTFDSTDEGNIGPVLDALRERLGTDRSVVVPAFPGTGRTVRDGSLWVGDDLLEDSSMRHHPLTPMTRSRLRDLLAPQTTATVTEIGLDVVRRGADALRQALDAAPAGYLVVDAVEDDDLRAIAQATAGHRLVSGGAGLALGLEPVATDAAGTGTAGTRAAAAAPFPSFSRRRLVVCGSASTTTQAQVAAAVAAGHPTRKVDIAQALADPEAETASLAEWVRGLDDVSVPVVYSVGQPSDVVPAGALPAGGAGAAVSASEVVETVLSGLVLDLVADGTVDQVVVAGGETSGAVVGSLGVGLLTIGPLLAPGVCWSAATTDDGREVALVLKSGNFGAVDLFSSAWEALA
ncbi:3-oxo-tetronate kinase [Frigoribacterium sp. CFBP 8766]|uniref:3-oxo-tetronate kinase n=1 Tax=Frigoribacterium sp. CFBP 8766 TaxID=2775273 RepID=UPI0018FE823C|nr:3-oxo-tetronate kinase [Frigoribacterium sp. CFBP 8766]